MSTFYLDLEGGNDSNDGTSFANRKKTWASLYPSVLAGDSVRVKASLGAVSTGINATWVAGGWKITLASPLNADIDTCESLWTASANVTVTTSPNSDMKEGTGVQSVAIAAAFTTGLAAYHAMASTDFSAYTQVAFWLKQTSGSLATAGQMVLKLCSDNAGVTAVNTLSIPAVGALNQWTPVLIDNAGALGSAIQSVALYVGSDLAAQTFELDNIIAVKTAGGSSELHFKKLIGKLNSWGFGGDDSQAFHCIRSIRGATVILDTTYSGFSSLVPSFTPNSSETVAFYTYDPSYMAGTAASTDVSGIWNGMPGSVIDISGGWSRVDMATQTGYTIAAMPYQNTTPAVNFGGSYYQMSRFGAAQFNNGTTTVAARNATITMGMAGLGGLSITGSNITATVIGSGTAITATGVNVSVTTLTSGNLTATGGATIAANSSSLPQSALPTAGQGVVTFNGVTYGGFDLTAAGVVSTLMAYATEGVETFQQMMRIIRAGVTGLVGITAGVYRFRDRADTKDRIVSTTDVNGQRLTVTTDGT